MNLPAAVNRAAPADGETRTPLPLSGAPDVVYILDLSGFVHRLFHAQGGWASYRFGETMKRIGQVQRPAYCVAAAEVSGRPTFRHEMTAGLPESRRYKGNRPDRSASERTELMTQERLCRELLEDVFEVPIIEARGFEADDVVATLTAQALDLGQRVVVCSRDKDLMQLVQGDFVWQWDPFIGTEEVWGPADVVAKFGVPPEQVADWLAIVGDSGDNVPGLRGLGPKAAGELLGAFPTLLDAVGAADRERDPETRGAFFKGHGKLWAALADRRQEAELMLKMVRLRQDAPVTLDLGAAQVRAWPDP